MNWQILNKRIHTLIGLVSALLLIFLSLTGVLLNHPTKWIKNYLNEPLTIAPDPAQSSILYQGRVDGLWYSDDKGTTWKEVEMLYPPIEVVDIAFHPRNPEKIFILQKWHGILSSTDGGNIWEPLPLSFDPQKKNIELSRIAIHPDDRITLMTSAGLIVSSDNGQNWTNIDFGENRQSAWHLIRNLHSGHFFGEWFIRIYDISFIAILILVLTGFLIWRIKEKRI